jgi:deoxyribose-phosphate aldolase
MDFSKETIAAEIMQLAKFSEQDSDINVLKTVFNLIDLTSLNTSDFDDKIKAMVEKVNRFNEHYSDCPNVAAICVYPNFVNTVSRT